MTMQRPRFTYKPINSSFSFPLGFVGRDIVGAALHTVIQRQPNIGSTSVCDSQCV